MKSILLLCLLTLFCRSANCQSNYVSPKLPLRGEFPGTNGVPVRLGVIGNIARQKVQIESFAASFLANEAVSAENKKFFSIDYNHLQAGYDEVLLQLIVSLRVANNLKIFRDLDQQNTQQDNKYRQALDTLAHFESKVLTTYEQLNFIPNNAPSGGYHAIITPLGLGTLAELVGVAASTIETARKAREAKVSNVTDILNALRIKPLVQILKPEATKESLATEIPKKK